MKRRDFLQLPAALPVLGKNMESEKMPVLFIGHGSPMNAVEDNPFTRSLAALGKSLEPRPAAILVVSAHWLTRGTWVAVHPQPETLYDFSGFPEALYKVKYPAPGSPAMARETARLSPDIRENGEWGLDHGAWTVLKHMYPKADIPVFQLSIDFHRPLAYHFELAGKLKALRRKGVLAVGSGNIVHNLPLFFSNPEGKPFPWAVEFDAWVEGRIDARDFRGLLDYARMGPAGKLAVPTTDHYIPMLYTLGLADEDDKIAYTYREMIGSIGMRGFRVG